MTAISSTFQAGMDIEGWVEQELPQKGKNMKALTLTQPWASLIAFGAKTVETRSWATSYRGPLAIHAAANLTPVGGVAGLQRLIQEAPFAKVLAARDQGWGTDIMHDPGYSLPRGTVVAICQLVGCYPTCGGGYTVPTGQPLTPFELRLVSPQEHAFGDFRPGRFAWLLRDVQPLDWPIAARGQLGLWDWEVLG